MKKLAIILLSVASFAWAQETALELTDPKAPNMGLSLQEGADTEGDVNDPTGFIQKQAKKEGRKPSANCPNCGDHNQPTENNPLELNGTQGPAKGSSGQTDEEGNQR